MRLLALGFYMALSSAAGSVIGDSISSEPLSTLNARNPNLTAGNNGSQLSKLPTRFQTVGVSLSKRSSLTTFQLRSLTSKTHQPRLHRRGACWSGICGEDPDMKLMKIPLPNPPIARTSSESRIHPSPFERIDTPPIGRGIDNIGPELNKQYSVFEKTNSGSWSPGMSRATPMSSREFMDEVMNRASRTVQLERHTAMQNPAKTKFDTSDARSGSNRLTVKEQRVRLDNAIHSASPAIAGVKRGPISAVPKGGRLSLIPMTSISPPRRWQEAKSSRAATGPWNNVKDKKPTGTIVAPKQSTTMVSTGRRGKQ